MSDVKFCKDCLNISKPAGVSYMPHPKSICLAGGILNYVTGEIEHWLCKFKNDDGHCPLFKERELDENL